MAEARSLKIRSKKTKTLSRAALHEREFTLKLISLYRDAPELWKVNSPFYYERNIKAATVTRITNALKVLDPKFTEQDLKKKINVLRTDFNRQRNKMKSSMRSRAGAKKVYVPRLWYFNEMMFLVDKVADTEGSVNLQNSSQTDYGSITQSQNIQQTKKIVQKHNDMKQELVSVIKSYFDKPNDEDELIAKAWSVQLKKLSDNQKCLAKAIINEVLYKGEMGTLKRSRACFSPSNSTVDALIAPNVCFSSQSQYSSSPEGSSSPDRTQSPESSESPEPPLVPTSPKLIRKPCRLSVPPKTYCGPLTKKSKTCKSRVKMDESSTSSYHNPSQSLIRQEQIFLNPSESLEIYHEHQGSTILT